MHLQRTRFETELQVRPDDIDMFRHVHSSRYLDYVLAARFDQMERCYGVSMEEFLKLGFGWVVKTAHFEYKRPLVMGEHFTVRTWVEGITGSDVEELRFGDNDKLSASVALLWQADLLILLTSVPGLMDLKEDGEANIIPVVHDVNNVLHLAADEKGALSVGGMASKLRAVADAVEGGIECIIASGRHPEQIADLVEGRGTCTRFPAKE